MKNFKHIAKRVEMLNHYINSENHMVFFDGEIINCEYTVEDEDISWFDKNSGFREYASELTNPMARFKEHEVYEIRPVNWQKTKVKHGEGV